LRGTAATLAVIAFLDQNTSTQTKTPCATTVRSWILRIGCAHLSRPLPRSSRWAWLIDHTMQIGACKLFVIVGVPLDDVPFSVRPLQLADLHLVAMVPMETSNHQRINDELEKAVARTGAPRQIVSDGASDLQKGIKNFQQRHPQTLSVPDVAHHAANLLKRYWEKDPKWVAFTRRMNETAARIRQTPAAYLLPPKLRNKARFLSVGKFVRFGRLLLKQLAANHADAVQYYSWVSEYEETLRVWNEQHELVEATLCQVRVEGLFGRGVAELDEAWSKIEASDEEVTVRLRNRLRAYVSRWSQSVLPGERLLGSTEILESSFGVQKRLSGDQSESGLTSLSIGLGAMLGEVTLDQIRTDVERVPEKVVTSWAKRMLGKTVQCLRRQFLGYSPTQTTVQPEPDSR